MSENDQKTQSGSAANLCYPPEDVDGLVGPMTLADVFERAKADGYTRAGDVYSYRGRKIGNWAKEIAADANQYMYDPKLGYARQPSRMSSNEWRFWRV